MEILDSIIEVLYKEENYWNICHPCQCKGYCCVGADISVYSNEWSIIKKYVQNLPVEEKSLLVKNITKNNQCIFRAKNKCLIHDVRPENCRYTPYQAGVYASNILKYSMVRINPITKQCHFKTVKKEISQEERRLFEQHCFVSLPNYDTYTKYISLNWLAINFPSNAKALCISEWQKEDPLL